jgi:hypothetical protein
MISKKVYFLILAVCLVSILSGFIVFWIQLGEPLDDQIQNIPQANIWASRYQTASAIQYVIYGASLCGFLFGITALMLDITRDKPIRLMQKILAIGNPLFFLLAISFFPAGKSMLMSDAVQYDGIRQRMLALEIERFRIEEGRYPNSLQSLMPRLEAAKTLWISQDSFSPNERNSYNYTLLTEKWMIYGVGPDQRLQIVEPTADTSNLWIYISEKLYDPSNGTQSAGDIVRFSE